MDIGTKLVLARLFDESGHRKQGDAVRAEIWRQTQPTYREALEARRAAGDIQDEDTYDPGAPHRRPRRDCSAYPRRLLEEAARLPSTRDANRIQEAIGRGETEPEIMAMVAMRSRASVADRFHTPPTPDATLPVERYDIERLVSHYMASRVMGAPRIRPRVPVIAELRRLWVLMPPI